VTNHPEPPALTGTTPPTPAGENRARVTALREQIEADLQQELQTTGTDSAAPITKESPQLLEAMSYATLAGGKRLRPLLCLATTVAAGGKTEQARHAARALEYLHTYSLIHDDLPAMDDDSLRRGKPTCHVVYGEADAILAGDALQTLAFATLAQQPAKPGTTVAMLQVLSSAAGWAGMVGGQSFDLALTGATRVTQTQLETLHAAKTGALLRASMELGAIAAEPEDPAILTLCTKIGSRLGLAFQVVDDVLDVTQTTAQLGKDSGSDAQQGKTTFVDLLGLQAAQEYARDLYNESDELLKELPGDTGLLNAIAWEVVFRNH